ncbi:hypothetical protein D3C79_643100 [compost metagenome]
MAEQAHGKVSEQPDHAGLFKERAEQDEQVDVGRRNIGGRAIQPLGSEGQLVDDLIEAVAAMRKVTGQVLAEQPVGQKKSANDGQCDAHHPARCLEHQADQQQAEHQVTCGQFPGALNQLPFEVPLVGSGGHARQAQQPAKRLPRPAMTSERVAQVHDQQQEPHVYCPQYLTGNQRKSRRCDLKGRKCQGHGKKRGRPTVSTGLQTLPGITHVPLPHGSSQ